MLNLQQKYQNYPSIINNNIQGLHINYSNHILQVPAEHMNNAGQ